MALSLTTGATIVANNVFQGRVAMAFYLVAREVISGTESGGIGEIRLRFAYSVIRQEYNEFLKLAAVIITDDSIVMAVPNNSTDQTAISDQLILTAVRNAWSRLAGVGM
jgi:hypothetical protein